MTQPRDTERLIREENKQLRAALRKIGQMRYSDKSDYVLDRIAHIALDALASVQTDNKDRTQ